MKRLVMPSKSRAYLPLRLRAGSFVLRGSLLYLFPCTQASKLNPARALTTYLKN
jgi:hypothetical protein